MIKQIWFHIKHIIECASVGLFLGAFFGGLYGALPLLVTSLANSSAESRPVHDLLLFVPISLFGLIPGGIVGSVTGGLIGGVIGPRAVTPQKAVRYGVGIAVSLVMILQVAVVPNLEWPRAAWTWVYLFGLPSVIFLLAVWWFMRRGYHLLTDDEDSLPDNSF